LCFRNRKNLLKTALVSLIYKICTRTQWREAERAGVFRGAPVDFEDGYIHFSGPDQVVETATKYFARSTDLLLIAVDGSVLGKELRWEGARGGALFPHLYGVLPLAAVVWTKPLPLGLDGKHVFPELDP
jgi:uncharacterized protein (DUF952 family)